MAESQALETRLQLALKKHMMPIETEVDSSEVIELFQYMHFNYQPSGILSVPTEEVEESSGMR